MLRGQSSHKKLGDWVSRLAESRPAADSTTWTEAKHSQGNNQSRQVFIAPSEGHQQSWPRVSEPDTSIPGREWVIITGGGGWLFPILPLHSWESSLPTANYVTTMISNNNFSHVSLMKHIPQIRVAILSSSQLTTTSTEIKHYRKGFWILFHSRGAPSSTVLFL